MTYSHDSLYIPYYFENLWFIILFSLSTRWKHHAVAAHDIYQYTVGCVNIRNVSMYMHMEIVNNSRMCGTTGAVTGGN